jgi:hypothetical protein
MSGPLKRQEIVTAVEQLKLTIGAWEQMPLSMAPSIIWRSAPHKTVSQEIEQAAAELFELVNTLEIEASAWPLVLAIDEFDDAFIAWAKACQFSPDRTDPSGSPEVWGAWNKLLTEMSLRSFSPPEPIAALVRDKVTHKNIAKIYGWYDSSGNPDVQMVQKEITNPGAHYKPESWVHPARRRFIAEIKSKWQAREAWLQKDRNRSAAAKDQPHEKKAPPESIEDLIRQGVNSKQIAKMHGVQRQQVIDLAAEMGIPLDGNTVADVMRRRKNAADELEEEAEIDRKAEKMRIDAIDSHAELGEDRKARILAMAADGVKPGDIARALSDSFPDINYQQVNRTLKPQKAAS